MPSNSSRKPTVFLVLLISAVFATGTCEENNDDCRILRIKPRIEGKALDGHVFKKLVLNAERGCKVQCFMEEDCVSFNVGPQQQDGKYECELSDSDHDVHPQDLKPRTGFTYTPAENFCSSDPCPLNSRCQTGFTKKGFRCVCSAGFTGKDCKTVKLGCFKDQPSGSRALPEHVKDLRSSIDWWNMGKTVQTCAELVSEKGWKIFGIQFYGECWSGPDAGKSYNKYGNSSQCWNGVGKAGVNYVYKIT